ncbi:hypothetical protein quinque_007582 [Culex quinquefasciatus]
MARGKSCKEYNILKNARNAQICKDARAVEDIKDDKERAKSIKMRLEDKGAEEVQKCKECRDARSAESAEECKVQRCRECRECAGSAGVQGCAGSAGVQGGGGVQGVLGVRGMKFPAEEVPSRRFHLVEDGEDKYAALGKANREHMHHEIDRLLKRSEQTLVNILLANNFINRTFPKFSSGGRGHLRRDVAEFRPEHGCRPELQNG